MKPVKFTDLKIGDTFIVPYLEGTNHSPWMCWWDGEESMLLTKVSSDSVMSAAFKAPQRGDKEKVDKVLVLRVR
jgi:hypothetical protein